jgi:hypothetical protein
MEDLFRNELARRRAAFAASRQIPMSPTAPTLPGTVNPAATGALGAAPGFGAPRPNRPGRPRLWGVSQPGVPAPIREYQYEPRPDGSFRVYPPGVQAPPGRPQTSMARAAHAGELQAMAGVLGRAFPNQPPGQPVPGETPEQAQARLSALPGRRVGQYRRAGLVPPPPPGTTPPPASGALGSQGPYIPGIPTMGDPYDEES